MSPALTAVTWQNTLHRYVRAGTDTEAALAAILLDIVNEIDDPKVAQILDTYGLRLLEKAP